MLKGEIVASVALSSVAIAIRDASLALFGVPVSAIALAFGGALAGLIHLPPPIDPTKVRFPTWAIGLANASTGIALGPFAVYLITATTKMDANIALGPICFLSAYGPVPIVNYIRKRLGVSNDAQ